MAICIGLDAHARTCTYVVKEQDGTKVAGGTIPSTRPDLGALAKEFPGATLVVEASGVTEWIYDHLTKAGLKVFACHPTNIRRVMGKKSDETDAGFLVDAYRLGALKESYVPPPSIRRLRELARRRAFLTWEQTRIKNRVHGILKKKGLHAAATGKDLPAQNLFAKSNRAALNRMGLPEVTMLLQLQDVFSVQQASVDKQVRSLVEKSPDMRNLETIPGFGPLASLVIVAEMGDVKRFPNAKCVASYFGLVPSLNQSGDVSHNGHITKRGSNLARWVLVQAAWSHVRSCPSSSIAKDYKRLAKRTGKKRAIVAVARKLLGVAYCLLREKRGFRVTG